MTACTEVVMENESASCLFASRRVWAAGAEYFRHYYQHSNVHNILTAWLTGGWSDILLWFFEGRASVKGVFTDVRDVSGWTEAGICCVNAANTQAELFNACVSVRFDDRR
jgi:hypothetical protein